MKCERDRFSVARQSVKSYNPVRGYNSARSYSLFQHLEWLICDLSMVLAPIRRSDMTVRERL